MAFATSWLPCSRPLTMAKIREGSFAWRPGSGKTAQCSTVGHLEENWYLKCLEAWKSKCYAVMLKNSVSWAGIQEHQLRVWQVGWSFWAKDQKWTQECNRWNQFVECIEEARGHDSSVCYEYYRPKYKKKRWTLHIYKGTSKYGKKKRVMLVSPDWAKQVLNLVAACQWDSSHMSSGCYFQLSTCYF